MLFEPKKNTVIDKKLKSYVSLVEKMKANGCENH